MTNRRLITLLGSICLILILAALPFLTACPAPPAEEEETPTPTPTEEETPTPTPTVEMPDTLVVMAGSSPGSGGDIEGRWIVEQISAVYPEIAIRHLPGSFLESAHKLDIGELDITIFSASTACRAWTGEQEFFLGVPHTNLRVLYTRPSPGSGIFFAVLDKSPIKQVSEIRNVKVATEQLSAAATKDFEKALKAVYGFDFSDIKAAGGLVVHTTMDQAAAMLGEGKVDVHLKQGPADNAEYLAVDRAQPIRFLPLEDKFLQYWVDDLSGYAFGVNFLRNLTLYKNLSPEQQCQRTVTPTVMWAVNADMPDEVAYNIIKAVMADDKGDSFMNKYKASWRDVVPPFRLADHATEARTIPFHPGAIKYWIEMGHKIPEPALK